MSDPKENQGRWSRFVCWVNGETETDPTTVYVMECRLPRRPRRGEEEHELRERRRLKKFLSLYPLAAGVMCFLLTMILLSAVAQMPAFGQADNPINNEVSEHYLDYSEEETGASNAVTAMILSYRGFDTLGESCVLFLAVSCVLMLLGRDKNNTDDHDLCVLRREDAIERDHGDNILQESARLLIPFIFLFAIYVLLNGEASPGGGFSGGAILSGGMILFSAAYGAERSGKVFTRRLYDAVRLSGLVLYALLYGMYIFLGANGLSARFAWMTLLIDLAVGLVVACTIYGFYTLFARGEI